MAFKEINVSREIEQRCTDSPEFKKTWEEIRAEYKLIGEMISLRKQEGITQSQLAVITGNKQQVISRIEQREHVPSLKLFSNILDALGYEIKIVKKQTP